ncbi:MAG: RHS repeat-associated core domain-containing protein [Candidatus Izemoplasmatales bacterium]
MLRKIVSIILCLFMVANSVIPQNNRLVYAYDSYDSGLNVESNADEVINYKTTSDVDFDISSLEIDSEVISKRTSDSKTFRKVDGTYVMAIYNSVIHYEQDGELKDIDNSLIYDESTNEYANTANSFSIKFPKEIDENKKFKLNYNDYQISWTVTGIDKSDINYYDNAKLSNNIKDLTNISQQLVYDNVQNNVNLEYILNGNEIKENILLEKYIEDFRMSFTYTLKGLILSEDANGNFVFMNEENEIIFLLNNMVMFDSEGAESSDIGLVVNQIKKDEYQIEIKPNDEFLKNANYPVTIDPTVTYYGDDNLIRDKYVFGSSSLDTNYIKAGYSGSVAYRSYLEFDISQIPDDVKINYAHLYLQTYTGRNYCTNDCTILAKEVLATVDYDNINAEGLNITSSREIDFANVLYSDGDTGTYMFDITYNMQRWTNSSTPYRTIELRSQDEGEYGYIWFNSENYSSTLGPVVEIGFVNTFGIKDYWTYNSQDIGIVGTGYVSDYTGYLTFTRTDFSFATDKQSLGVSFAYNNSEKDNNIGYGDGWNVSYNTKIDYDDDLDLYYTTDFTGNIVYYYPTSCPSNYLSGYPYTDTCYVSEDGSAKILNKKTIYGSLAGYYIYDGANRFSYNNSGYLTSIKEIEYSLYITISRDSTYPDRINYVKDSSNNYLRFYYSNDSLSYILLRTAKIESDGTSTDYLEKVVYTYESGTEDISQVKYYSDYDQDNDTNIDATANYDYDYYDRLQYAYVTNGEKIEYTYINTINDKIMTIESFFDTTKFSEVNYDYGFRETTITDHTGSFVIYKFDDYGHTTNIIDKKTNTVYYNYIDIFNDESTYVSGDYNYYRNNELIYQSVPQKLTYNPVENYSFEIGTYTGWSLSQLTAYKSSIECVGNYSIATNDFSTGGYAYQDIVLNEGVYTFRASIYNTSGSDNGAYIQVLGVSSEEVESGSGWQNVSVPIYVREDNTEITLYLYNETGGNVRFDNVSVVDGINDSRVNIVENSSFENNGTTGWVISDPNYTTYYSINDGNNDINDTFEWILSEHAVGIKGSATDIRSISTTIEKNYFDQIGNGGTFYVGSWANTYSSPLVGNTNYDGDKVFRITVEFVDSNGNVINSEDTQHVDFNQCIYSWQYIYGEIDVPSYTYTSARISFEYQGLGEVIFDGISVFFEASNKAYEYDDLDRLIRITWDDGKEYNFLYASDEDYYPYQAIDENNNVVMELDSDGSELEYVEKNNIKSTPTYNSYGQVTGMEISGYGSYYEMTQGYETTYFTTSTTYMWNSQYLATSTDEFGNTTEYQTEELTGLLEYIENAKGVKTQYEYYDNGMLYRVYVGESSTGAPYVKYVYDDQNRLIEIELDEDYSYFIHYDDAGRMDQVMVNTQLLMSYSYLENEVNLINVYDFGNNNIYESSGIIYTSSGYSTVTYNDETVELQANQINVDPNFGGFIEVEGSTTYTVSADILSITGSAMFNIFEYSGDPSTSTYIRVQKSSYISSPGELTKEFTTSSTTQYVIIAFYSSSTYTLEFRDLLLDENDGVETGILSNQTYGNGDEISFVYNEDGQVEYIRFTNSFGTEVTRFHYLYDSYGRVSVYEDLVNGTSENYEYDMQGRLSKVKFSNDDEIVYQYDDQGNLSNIEYNFGTITSNTYYNFETGAEQDFYDFTLYNNGNNTIKKDYIYNDYGLRNLLEIKYFLNSNSTSYFNLEFDYVTNTTRIDEITYNFTYSGYTDISYKYYYDSLGNITKEEYKENGSVQVKKEYVYDDYNQLIQESSRDYQYTTESAYENTNYSKYYYYDINGNIIDIREYGYGISDTVSPTIPSYYLSNNGSYTAVMFYNGSNDYMDTYNLAIGQTPSLSFIYYDMWDSNHDYPLTGMTTAMTYSNLNTSVEGYYYRTYHATYSNYDLTFRIVFKVGNPVGDFRSAEKHVSYTYDDDWLDQLESYSVLDNGVTKTSNISYDNQGNPTQITNFNYMGTKYNFATLHWDGRELVNITVYNSSLAVVAEIDYTYNDERIRIKKVIEDPLGMTTYDYILSGSSLVAEIVDNGYDSITGLRNQDYKILYNYDYYGTIIGFTLYSQGYTFDYIYVMNQFGDITHIITTSGTVAVEYKYDAFGNVVKVIGDAYIANANSFRYRSYKYDTETSFYYLKTRYYNPEISRFINSDGLLGRDTSLKSTNMYAYCENNPIAYVDPEGESILLTLTVILVSSLVAFCVVATTPADSGTGDNISVSAGGGTPDSAGFGGDAMGVGFGVQTNITSESCNAYGECSESTTTVNAQVGPFGGSHSINEDGSQSITASFLIFYVSVDPTNPLDLQSYGAGLSWSISGGQPGVGSFSASYDIDFFGLIVDAFKGGSDNESD